MIIGLLGHKNHNFKEIILLSIKLRVRLMFWQIRNTIGFEWQEELESKEMRTKLPLFFIPTYSYLTRVSIGSLEFLFLSSSIEKIIGKYLPVNY